MWRLSILGLFVLCNCCHGKIEIDEFCLTNPESNTLECSHPDGVTYSKDFSEAHDYVCLKTKDFNMILKEIKIEKVYK